MDYVILGFVSIAVLYGIGSFAMGLFLFLRKAGTKSSFCYERSFMILRNILPAIVAAILVTLFFEKTFTPIELLLFGGTLYMCVGAVALLTTRKNMPN